MKQTRIICLKGRHNCGKTTTLNYLIDLLDVRINGGTMPTPHKGDRRKVFIYKGLIIGISTYGDTENILTQNCKFFEDNACDIAFSACLTRGKTCAVLDHFAANNPGSTVTSVKKIIETNANMRSQKNLNQATDLLNMI